RGDVANQSGLLIAEYKDYGVKIEIEEVKEILAGYDDDTEDFKTAKVVIEETVENSLASGRMIDFELPSWVRIATGQEIDVTNKTSGGSDFTVGKDDLNKDRNEF